MSSIEMAKRIQLRRDTGSNWSAVNPTLAQGEPAVETDTSRFKIGNGNDPWNLLKYAANSGIIDTTYEELMEMINDYQGELNLPGKQLKGPGRLVPGQLYRFDFETVYFMVDSQNNYLFEGEQKIIRTGETESLVVMAVLPNALLKQAWSLAFPGDILEYCADIDINSEVYPGFFDYQNGVRPAGFKGYISKRTDTERFLSATLDFRSFYFRRWSISQEPWRSDLEYGVGAWVQNGTKIYFAVDSNNQGIGPGVAQNWKNHWFEVLDIAFTGEYITGSANGLYFSLNSGFIPVNNQMNFIDAKCFGGNNWEISIETLWVPNIVIGEYSCAIYAEKWVGSLTVGSDSYEVHVKSCGDICIGDNCYHLFFDIGNGTVVIAQGNQQCELGKNNYSVLLREWGNGHKIGSYNEIIIIGQNNYRSEIGDRCYSLQTGYGCSMNSFRGQNANIILPEFSAMNEFKERASDHDFTIEDTERMDFWGTPVEHVSIHGEIFQKYIQVTDGIPAHVIAQNKIGYSD